MKATALIAVIFVFLGLQAGAKADEVENMLENIHWLGHSAFRIDAGGKTIYVDPYNIFKGPVADIILITHAHYDHCSPDDVKKIQGPNTVIVATQDSAKKFKGNIRVVKPFEKINISGIDIETVPAYNLNKPNHLKQSGWVGYIIDVNGVKVYHAGDTDYIPEMNTLKLDIALVPVGGTYTMDANEAAKFVNTVKPKIAVPMHWGSAVGSRADAQNFKVLCKTQVEIPTQ
ncbi:MAG: MBL fold metallo-hydrolase [Candidatus Omnitrophota bacterium]